MIDPIDGAAAVTRALNVWTSIKLLGGTATAAAIEAQLTALLSNDPLDNIDPISAVYVSTGLAYLQGIGAVSVTGSGYTIADVTRLLERDGSGLQRMPAGTAFRQGLSW
jgi:hypothetical protein